MKKTKLQVSSYKFQLLIVFILVTCYLLLATSTTNAQSVSLSISPPLVELLIKPGKSALIAYTVGNNGDPIVLSSHVGTFSPKGINGQISLNQELLGPIRFNLENSDTKLNQSVYLKSGQKQQFLLKIRIPNNIIPADYYYTFYVKSDPGPLFIGQNISKSTAVIGSNIIISVTPDGQIETKGEIAEFRLIGNNGINIFGKKRYFIESSSKIPVSLIVKNTGNNVIKPFGEIEVTGPLGKLSKHKLTPVNIIKKSERIVPATPSAKINTGSNNTNPSLIIDGFFIGNHKIKADLNFGENTPQKSATIEFIAVPLRLIMGLMIMIAVACVIVFRLKKSTIIE